MKHEELLAKIDDFNSDEGIAIAIGDINNALYALRAVVILHKPVYNEYFAYYDNEGCFACNEIWPCFTIQAIQKDLK